ncbi:hypothetical protein QJS10_CPB17g02347 [Acorus calamus]|uniref:Uncharacterized protein n=1 Tax=Acorus calamus TaxID=4465 RepID=A0AAV9CW84_ACOCL|nr:hypothetical protein QJS10_CPB17g02347 [Acorus calamus]
MKRGTMVTIREIQKVEMVERGVVLDSSDEDIEDENAMSLASPGFQQEQLAPDSTCNAENLTGKGCVNLEEQKSIKLEIKTLKEAGTPPVLLPKDEMNGHVKPSQHGSDSILFFLIDLSTLHLTCVLRCDCGQRFDCLGVMNEAGEEPQVPNNQQSKEMKIKIKIKMKNKPHPLHHNQTHHPDPSVPCPASATSTGPPIPTTHGS